VKLIHGKESMPGCTHEPDMRMSKKVLTNARKIDYYENENYKKLHLRFKQRKSLFNKIHVILKY